MHSFITIHHPCGELEHVTGVEMLDFLGESNVFKNLGGKIWSSIGGNANLIGEVAQGATFY